MTLKELSDMCGVSIATVSNVINGKNNVSLETKKRILEVIEKTGFQPNFMAKSLRAIKTRTVGLIVEDITAFSSPEIISGIMEYCETKNYRCILENLRYFSKYIDQKPSIYKNVMDYAVQKMLQIKVDGIIVVAAYSRKMDCFPESMKIPGVIAYASSSSPKYPSVVINDEKAGFEITELLLNKKCRHIAMITGVKDNIHSSRRYNGYVKALRKYEVKEDPSIVFEGRWDRESGYRLASEILEKKADGVFCANDLMAAGVCDYLHEKGLVPGKDILVAGFDGREFQAFMTPALTTMAIPLFEIGEKAGELILSQINGEKIDSVEYEIDCVMTMGGTV